jgi:hypothetical protein
MAAAATATGGAFGAATATGGAAATALACLLPAGTAAGLFVSSLKLPTALLSFARTLLLLAVDL